MYGLSFRRVLAGCALLGVVLAAGYAVVPASEADERVVREVRWLVSHQPVDVFARATEVFAAELTAATDGTMKVVIVTPEELGLSTKGDVPEATLSALMQNGTIDIASPYTVALGERHEDFWALGLPFLYTDYASATTALEGETGQNILQGLSLNAPLHGLAFTMSGGFRVIASRHSTIESVSDFKGKRIATSGGPVAEATLRALGAIPVPLDLESGTPVDLSAVDGVETTYARLASLVGSESGYTKYVSETNHSLFLTVLTASESFYNSLDEHQRDAIERAATAAARVEREDSIALNAATKEALIKSGSIVAQLSTENREDMRRSSVSVFTAFPGLAQIVSGK